MASISCNQVAQELLACCLAGQPWDVRLVHHLVDHDCSGALFGVVVERLADLFEPRLCPVYARLMSQALARADPSLNAEELLERYQHIRQPRVCSVDAVERVFVLSRVTLGADIVVTSIVLEAARRRFPDAEVYLVGSAKVAELFAAEPGIRHLPVTYPKSASLRERLAPWQGLRELLSGARSLVIDPDSRLTQLGLLPVCDDTRYFFFESRSYGSEGDETLAALTSRWASETFGIASGRSWIAPQPAAGKWDAAVSLGVGENAAKRLPPEFEAGLLQELGRSAGTICIDKGAGGEEAVRVEAAISASGISRQRFTLWDGSFAAFAARIARSGLYVGYDSAGQHAAAALGVPLVTIFAGYVSERFLSRWRPAGEGPVEIVKADQHPFPLEAVAEAVATVRPR